MTKSNMIKIKMSKELWKYMQETHVAQAFGFWPKELKEEFISIYNDKNIPNYAFEGLNVVSHDRWERYQDRHVRGVDNKYHYHFSSEVLPDYTSHIVLSYYFHNYLTKKCQHTIFYHYPEDIKEVLNYLRHNHGKDIQYLSIGTDNNSNNLSWVNFNGNFSDDCISSYHYRLDPKAKVIII